MDQPSPGDQDTSRQSGWKSPVEPSPSWGSEQALGRKEWQVGNRDWRQEAVVSGDRLGMGSVSCGLLWSTLVPEATVSFISETSSAMSLRRHIVGCSRDARLCCGLMAAVLMLGEGRTPGRRPTSCVALMGVAPISGLWRRDLSSSRNKKAEGLEHMVVSGLGRAGGEGVRDGWNSQVCHCRHTWVIDWWPQSVAWWAR